MHRFVLIGACVGPRWPPGAALDLAHDSLELRSGSLAVPALVIRPEIDPIAAATISHPKTPGHGASVPPLVRLDRAGSRPWHGAEGTALATGAHRAVAEALRVLRLFSAGPAWRPAVGDDAPRSTARCPGVRIEAATAGRRRSSRHRAPPRAHAPTPPPARAMQRPRRRSGDDQVSAFGAQPRPRIPSVHVSD